MASIKSSRAKTYRTKTAIAEDEAPEHVPSEGELLIKEMVKKQLDTQVSLQHQLQEEKEFEKAVEFESVTQYVSGQSTLKEFEQSTTAVARREDLHSYGLTGEEIELLLVREKGEEYFREKFKNVEGSILQSRMATIQSKVDEGISSLNKEESPSEGSSRQDYQLGQTVKPTSELAKLYQFASQCKPISKDTRLSTHPINQLKEIEHDLFGHLSKPLTSKKKKKLLSKNKSVPTPSPVNEELALTCDDNTIRKRVGSQWDVETVTTPKSTSLKREYTCKPKTLYTIKNKKIVQVNQNSAEITSTSQVDSSTDRLFGKEFVLVTVPDKDESTTNKEQLTLEQIKELARFTNYTPGIPSKILYLKNLPDNVKEEDLVTLFGEFESTTKPRTKYRLMCGKMKGQAFITFSDVETATTAFESVNGRFLKGRPVIIEYGRAAL